MPISKEERQNLYNDIRQQYTLPVEVLPAAMQMQPDVISGQLASPLGITPVSEFEETSGASYLKEDLPDIAGSVYGGIKGAKMGRPFGAVGQVIGGALGGILGSTGGKMAQETSEYRSVIEEPNIPEQDRYDFSSALGVSALEEAGGRIIGGVAAPFVQKGYQAVKNIGDYFAYKGINPLGKSRAELDLQDALVDYSIIDPTIKKTIGVREAQERQFDGEKPLTIFEETGGQYGAGFQNVLLDRTSEEARLRNVPTFYMKEREKYINRLKENILGEDNLDIVDRASFDALQNTLTSTRKSLDGAVNDASKIARESGRKVNLNTFDLQNKISQVKPELEKIGIEESGKIFNELNSLVKKYTKDKKISATNFIDLQKSINNLKGRFAETKEAQSELAGVLSDTVDPIFNEVLEKNKILAEAGDKQLNSFFADYSKYQQTARDRRDFLNSRAVKKFGSKKYLQDKDALIPDTVSKFAFKDIENYRAIRDMLEDKPELLAKVNNGIKADVFKKIYDSESKEFNYNSLKKLLNNQEFVGVAKEVGGDKFVQNLYDTALIQYAYDQTAKKAGTQLLPTQKIGQNVTRFLVHPLAGRIGLSSALLSKGRRAIGLGDITDKQMYEFIKSDKGQQVIKDVLNSPLNTPEGYNAYMQVVRELNKAGMEDVNLLAAPAFFAGAGEIIGTVLNSIDINSGGGIMPSGESQ